MDYLSLLKLLLSVVSVAGCEKTAAESLLAHPEFTEGFDSAETDPIGNLILTKKAPSPDAPSVMLDAHLDEVGFRVKAVHEGGFVSVSPVGGIDTLLLPASEVVIHGKEDIYGVFTVTPPHLSKREDADKLPDFDSLYIDSGYEKETLKSLVSPGDPVTYRSEVNELLFRRVSGRAFDDKACAAALMCAVGSTPRDSLAYNVYITLSSREEVGGNGASCAAVRLKPDFAVVTDVNFARSPGVPEDESGPIGGGPMISLSAVTDRGLTDKIISKARESEIPITPVVESYSTGTNASCVYVAGEGVPCAVLSLPLSGMHSAVESISLDDVDKFISLVREIITDGSVIDSLTYVGSGEKARVDAGDSAPEGTELMRELCSYIAPSGNERSLAQRIYEIVSPYADDTNIYPDGSVIALIRGDGCGEKLMLSAHMDEVGFMVKSVTAEGLLKPAKISVSDPKVLAGRRVLICGRDGTVHGHVGVSPVHMSKGKKPPSYEDLYIDIGASTAEDAEAVCPPGSPGVFDSDFVRFGEDGRMLKGRAIDDRLGCTVLCDLLRRMKRESLRRLGDVYFTFTCREELRISGSATAARRICPDLAIVVESTAAADVYPVPRTMNVARQGDGGALSVVDRSTVYDKDLTELILRLAADAGIPCQLKKLDSGGNDAGHIRGTCGGVRCAAISAPSRYIHTASCVIRESDLYSIESALWEFLRRR